LSLGKFVPVGRSDRIRAQADDLPALVEGAVAQLILCVEAGKHRLADDFDFRRALTFLGHVQKSFVVSIDAGPAGMLA
jgi:hypothetical protein